jgi:hypothetical protein
MQFLFPYRDRVTVIATNPCDFAEIAGRYGIPQVHVERYLSPPYMELFGALDRLQQ